jgi:hypothetical protein
MDGAATPRGLSVGVRHHVTCCATLIASSVVICEAGHGHADERGAVASRVAMASCVRRTRDRDDSARMPGPRDCRVRRQ